MKTTKIEWTDRTWNPVTGCSKVSAGCQNCYACAMAARLKAMGNAKYRNGFEVTLHVEAIDEPLHWTAPSNIFVCSMGDLFHEKVPFSFIDMVISTIEKTPQHIYQFLTKRPQIMAEYFRNREVPSNVWLGTTVDVLESKTKIDILREIPATVRFLSCEPLLEDLGELDLTGITWVIVGGESGVKARPMSEAWIENIYRQTRIQKVKFFFKQWGTWGPDGVRRNKKANGKLFKGAIIQEVPDSFVIQKK